MAAAVRPRLALVPGEPGGVGPELCVRIAQQPQESELVVYGDGETLLAAAHALHLPLRLRGLNEYCAPGELALVEHRNAQPVQFGFADAANASAVIGALLAAAADARSGQVGGMVTGPVNKASINRGGIPYVGTTELLAAEAGVPVVMMLANPTLRVALATTHLPLRAVADALTAEGLTRVLRITEHALRTDFGIANPRLRVLGLNPHAGESGELGREEIDIIAPVITALRSEGMLLEGPIPADSAFLPGTLPSTAAVIAMYHDQGLPVLKSTGFEDAVNITLGLPYPRVAVDHGTALNLAGTGRASASSLEHALRLCTHLARRKSARDTHA